MTLTETLVADRYRVIRALGAGGMGRVWLARDEVLCRDVAIKEIVLPFGLPDAQREEMRLRTLREARAAARLSHPNVVQIYDVQSGDEQPWIVMEYVRSRSLLQVIEENGPLPVDQVAGIGLAVLSALDAANRVGVLHRDVKPSNVLIADDGRVVLTDFGSAMIDEGEGALTRTGVILGSPQFIAPERVDKGISTPEADLWSLGATLYAAVEGRPPYTRATTYRSLVALTSDKPDPTRLAGPLKPVLTGLLQRNPQARMKPADIEERLRRLADVETTVHLRRIPEQRSPEGAGTTAAAALPAVPLENDTTASHPQPSRPQPSDRQPSDRQPSDRQPSDRQPSDRQPSDRQPSSTDLAHRPRPVSVPLPVPLPLPARPRFRRWRLVAATAIAAIVIPLAGSAAYPKLTAAPDGDTTNKPGAVRANASATVPGTPAPSASSPVGTTPLPSISLAGFTLPDTFRWWKDRTGYQLAFPANYSFQREGPQAMFFCAPGGPPTIRVRVLDGAGTDLTAALRAEERKADLPGYRRIQLQSILDGRDGAIWEYTFTDPKAGRLHGLERVFAAGGHTYLVQWRTPSKKWAAGHRTYTVVVNSFRPTKNT